MLDTIKSTTAKKDSECVAGVRTFDRVAFPEKMGWLFTGSLPPKPKIKFHYRLFKGILIDKIATTFNDKNKMLFRNLLAIIEYNGAGYTSKKFMYGTYRFEYVWESMIDKVYGVSDKKEYFPRTYWNIGETEAPNACLEPDTIMIFDNDIYVLDAKYYKYGATKEVEDLPGSTSINKQITYGEYIDGQRKFREKYGKEMKVYNAFLMPFNASSDKWMTEKKVVRVGQAYGDWKTNLKSYEKVQGIVVDIKHLMSIFTRENEEEIRILAEQIKSYSMN